MTIDRWILAIAGIFILLSVSLAIGILLTGYGLLFLLVLIYCNHHLQVSAH
jgi:hypothetical protein